MRIIYLHQYFNTPAQGGSLRSYYIAKAMIEAGHEVVMITTHNQKEADIKNIEGIEVHYLPIPYQNAFGFWQRIRAFFHFAQASYKAVLALPTPAIIYATSTPLTVGLSALWIKKKLKVPYFFEVRDLWPLVPIQLGLLRNPILKWLTKRWEKRIYQNAQKIITLSPAMQTHVKNIVPDKDVCMVPNMAQPLTLTPIKKKIFTVAYFGTVGYANHLEYLVEIAQKCASMELAVEFWIVGKGAKFESVKSLAESYKLTNILFFAHKNTPELQAMLAEVDAVYISFLANPVLGSTSPNKFFEGLAAGKLCVVNTEGWLKDLVEQNQCGFYASPTEPIEFVEKISPFLQNEALLKKYQQNAQNLAEKEFSVELLASKIVALFDTGSSKVIKE